MQAQLRDLLKVQREASTLVNEKNSFDRVKSLLVATILQRNSFIKSIGLLHDLETNSSLEYLISKSFPVTCQYMPGFLSLRNEKPIIEVINHFKGKFDVVMIEGAGRQHPRKFGLACDIGIRKNISIFGIIKKSLWGKIDSNNPLLYSEHIAFPVLDGDDKIAYFVRKKDNKRGVFISVGNNISLNSALEILIPMLKHRIPEPMRLAKALLKNET